MFYHASVGNALVILQPDIGVLVWMMFWVCPPDRFVLIQASKIQFLIMQNMITRQAQCLTDELLD